MKILLQAYNTFQQNKGGGVQTRINALYNEYLRLGYDVTLFDKWTTKIEDFDIIHFFKVDFEHYNLISYAKKKNKKVVISSIMPLIDSSRIKLNLLLCKYLPFHTVFDLNKKIMDMCDKIITQSKPESEFINKNYGIKLEKLIELPNGFETKIENGDPELIRQELPFDGDFVLQVGRIDHNKNQLNIIKALKGTGIPIVIIGGPDPYEPDYLELCKKKSDHNVYFTGWISLKDPRLASAYAAAKVLVLPSIHETFGNVLIEGGISGCNLACSKSLPILEWDIKDYVKTFDPNSIDNIRDTLTIAFNSTPKEKQVTTFKQFFSWERIANEHIKIYKSLLSK